jgi:SAM-dependent methyltransferase
VNGSYQAHYEQLVGSGLFDKLVSSGWLVGHRELDLAQAATSEAYKVIEPDRIPIITYPYEWCFGQLKDAALVTLRAQRTALEHGMWLKDASAYNVQFRGGAAVLIDTLSFERYPEGRPWVAYRQFCQHFLAPLALAARRNVALIQLMRVYIDGIPLDLASRLLPRQSWISIGLMAHIHLHSRSQRRHSDAGAEGKLTSATPKVSRLGMVGLIDGLERTVRNLSWRGAGTEWGDYYSETNYDDVAESSKEALVKELLGAISPSPAFVLDVGANTGRFTRIACPLGGQVVAADIDPVAVERGYQQTKAEGSENLVSVVLDLTNPPGATGWANEERQAFFERTPRDTVMALALIHHLAISNNLDLDRLARFFHSICVNLIIEFVPKSDSQVKRLLASREDIFPHYDAESFEAAFGSLFEIVQRRPVEGSERTLYLMCAKS